MVVTTNTSFTGAFPQTVTVFTGTVSSATVTYNAGAAGVLSVNLASSNSILYVALALLALLFWSIICLNLFLSLLFINIIKKFNLNINLLNNHLHFYIYLSSIWLISVFNFFAYFLRECNLFNQFFISSYLKCNGIIANCCFLLKAVCISE